MNAYSNSGAEEKTHFSCQLGYAQASQTLIAMSHATTKRLDLIFSFQSFMMNLNTKFFLQYNQPKHYGKVKSLNISNSIPSLLTNMEKLESVRSGSMLFNLLDSIPTSKSSKQYQKRLSQSKSAYLATHKSIREFKFDKLIGLCKFLHVFV